MQEGDEEVTFSTGMSDEHRAAILQFLREMDGHISAIQAGARERLASSASAGVPVPEEIRIEIRTGGDPDAAAQNEPIASTPYCWTESRPCGKNSTGYIYCTVKICEFTGPVVVAPG